MVSTFELKRTLCAIAQVALAISFALALTNCGQTETSISPATIALNDRGVSKMGQFQYSDAFEDFTAVVQKSPEWEVGLVNLAIATLNRQNPDDELLTLETLQTVLELNPSNVRALYTSGIVNLYLGNTAQAIDFLTKSVELDPNDAFATYFLGQAHLQAGNFEQARSWLLQTLELNSAIRSAYWAAATASRRIGDIDKATELIDRYQAFEHNPLSVSAGFSYKQMGPKAEAQSIVADVVQLTEKPMGDLFDEATLLADDLQAVASVSSFDVNQDKVWDLLISDASGNSLWLGNGTSFERASFSGLSGTLKASAWGDLDNDGTTELITCTDVELTVYDINQMAASKRTVIEPSACTTVRVLDADHDGALDVLSGGAFGLAIYHNDREGGFTRYAPDDVLGLDEAVAQILAEDLDRDRDVDLVLRGANSRNRALRNELTWNYETYPELESLADSQIVAMTALDVEVDGHLELILADVNGSIDVWDIAGATVNTRRLYLEAFDILDMAADDFDGDGVGDLFVAHRNGFAVLDPRTSTLKALVELANLHGALPVYASPGSGLGVVAYADSGVHYYAPGAGRYPFLAVEPSGKTSADQMRSNASGIGTYIKLRADTRWSLGSNFPSHSGPSQSLRPLLFGSGGATQADYIEMLWSDGVTQSEIGLAFGKFHRVEEIQRQLASCPVVFVWNGEKYEFVSDVLGVAALGYFAEPGATTPVRSFERLLMPPGLMQPRNGKFEVKIGEPMEEVLYLDSASLLYYDVPANLSVVLDERLNVRSVAPTGEPMFFENSYSPVRAWTSLDDDVLESVTHADLIAVDPGKVDSRYIGLTESEHALTLEFSQPLPVKDAVLVIDGWVEFPYSQTSFAAFNSSTPYEAPTLEARDGNGEWQVVAAQFGFPAGMPRQMALPLPPLPEGVDALRLRSNLEVYWDRVRVVRVKPDVDIRRQEAKRLRAIARSPGYARRTTGPQRTPYYDYDDRLTYWDAKHADGFYSAMGDVSELVATTDSSVAIIGSGEEIHLEFEVPPPAAPGVKRHFVLDFRGWAKDMDLYTTTGDAVEPIPQLSDASADELIRRAALHAKYNVRHQSGLATP